MKHGELKLTIGALYSDTPIVGADTTILEMPQRFYAEVGGRRTLLGTQFGRFLRTLARQQAASLGEDLHHAEFTVTANPATVEALGQLHDCDLCRAGVRSAVERMAEHPEKEMVVGQLFWAAPDATLRGGDGK